MQLPTTGLLPGFSQKQRVRVRPTPNAEKPNSNRLFVATINNPAPTRRFRAIELEVVRGWPT